MAQRPDARIAAYLAIDTEREFQNRTILTPSRSIAEHILVIEKLVADAKHAVYYGDGVSAQDHMRKVAAVAVADMEINGVVPRNR